MKMNKKGKDKSMTFDKLYNRKRNKTLAISCIIAILLIAGFIAITIKGTSKSDLDYENMASKIIEENWKISKDEMSLHAVDKIIKDGSKKMSVDTNIESLVISRDETDNILKYSYDMIIDGESISNEFAVEIVDKVYANVQNMQLIEEDEFLDSCKNKVKEFLIKYNVCSEDSNIISELYNTKFYLADFKEQSSIANTQNGNIYINRYYREKNIIVEWFIVHELLHVVVDATCENHANGVLNEVITDIYALMICPSFVNLAPVSSYCGYYEFGSYIFSIMTMEEMNNYYFYGDTSVLNEKMNGNFSYYEELVDYSYNKDCLYLILCIANNNS